MYAMMKVLLVLLIVTNFFVIYLFHNFDLNIKRSKSIKVKTEIYPTYYDDGLHKEWPFIISKNYNELVTCEWSEPMKSINTIPHGFGEGGEAFILPDDTNELAEQLFDQHKYNLLASDMMSLHRSLPDLRYDECKTLSYPKKLPTTSVIIIFHNEAWTTLLRTVWSVLDRSPPELIAEIILVDDMSTWKMLKRPLDDYIGLIPARVKLVRTSKREGLIRARLIGAQRATGNVLTFLDAHIECCEGWLQPLLSRIAYDRSVIAVPTIDGISKYDMSYHDFENGNIIYGFQWSLTFYGLPVPERERIRNHYDPTAPIRTPTMVGCAFSIDREFFYELGSYDEGMNIWGSENMEMSFRVWQCGGSLEIITCSRIGHLFRESTYSFDGNKEEIKLKNSIRVLEVWMDDLKKLYYETIPRSKLYSGGNLTERIQLQKRLKCKSFRWYLQNIYPESTMNNEFIYIGAIQSVAEERCVDVSIGHINSPLQMYTCHGLGGNQLFGFTKSQTIVINPDLCIGVNDETFVVVAVRCTKPESQLWNYDNETKWLIHTSKGLCMQANDGKVILGKCDPADDTFKWNIISST